MGLLKRIGGSPPPPKDRYELRKWWHGVLRDHDHYTCYAIFLALPGDTEVLKFLTKFSRELDLLTGENCLILALERSGFRRYGVDNRLRKIERNTLLPELPEFFEKIWIAMMREQVEKGYSLQVAQLFNIEYDAFPCLVLFQDIRSQQHILANFKGMTNLEIATVIRNIFSTVQSAAKSGENPLVALERQRRDEKLVKAGKSIMSELRDLANATFDSAMTAWIKSIF